MYYLGIDGGGSKTIFLLTDETGNHLASWKAGSASYKQIGIEGVARLVEEGIRQVFYEAGITKAGEIPWKELSCCLGLPMYGESRPNDEQVARQLALQLPNLQLRLVNDVQVGWAGSLLLESGINVVAGTGSIAYGRNRKGEEARCGGWSEWFSDEGSGRWLGMKCMELFSKEADGRIERGPLYELVRERFSLDEDTEMIDVFEGSILERRERIAALQEILLEAAGQKDEAALGAYEAAAEELALMAITLKKRLFGEETCVAAGSGGIFKVGEVLLEPFGKRLEKAGIRLIPAQASPQAGAVLLAFEAVNEGSPREEFIKNIKK